MKEAQEILDTTETLHERVADTLRPAAEWFHDHEGQMFEREEARDKLPDALEIDTDVADETISQLVSDLVDPVVQVKTNGTRYVGVAEFHEFDGAYGYLEYDDVIGERRRVVCQQCVNEADYDSEVSHATEKSKKPESSTYKSEVSYDDLLERVHDHYKDAHEIKPSEIETGATLASGTTVGGNSVYHDGNFTPKWFDGNGDNVYTLPNSTDGIKVGSANINELSITNGLGKPIQHDGYVFFDGAPPTGTIDDWEDGDMSEWTKYGFTGEASTSVVYEGSYALRLAADGGSGNVTVTSGSGLPIYPSRPCRIRWQVNLYNNPYRTQFEWARSSTNDNPNEAYQFVITSNAGEIRLGGTGLSDSVATNLPQSEWLTAEIHWGVDGTIVGRLLDATGTELGVVKDKDNTLSNGPIAFYGTTTNNAEEYYHDILELY